MRLINRPESEWVARVGNPADRAEVERLADPAVSLAIPMLRRGRVAGSIGIRFTKRQEFRPEDLDLSRALAQQAMLEQ